METLKDKIVRFMTVDNKYGSGYGDGSGYDYGDGDGYGDGSGYGYGYGYGYGSGSGSGYGSGYGYGYGSGYGYGYGSGYGYGYGSGYGYGYGYGLKSLDNQPIYYIDGIPTIITNIRNNIAKGYIVDSDTLSTSPCYVARIGNSFAHAENMKQAVDEAMQKHIGSMNVDERIAEFVKTFNNTDSYSGQDFFTWHNILTGSCLMGREQFVKQHGYSLTDKYTVKEFIAICENDFGGDVIKRLKEYYK